MKPLKALLVDLDGTLVDTSEANFKAYQAALEVVGVDMTRAWWEAKGFGRNSRQFLPELLKGHPHVDPKSVATEKARLYPQFLDGIRLNANLAGLLQAVRPRVGVALVTTASAAATEAVIDRCDLRGLFDTIVTGDDVTAHKPSPDAYVEAARRFGVSAEDCLIIEDSGIGTAAAQAFGAPFLIVPAICAK